MSHFPRISGGHTDLAVKGEFRIHGGIVRWGADGLFPVENLPIFLKTSPPTISQRQSLGRDAVQSQGLWGKPESSRGF